MNAHLSCFLLVASRAAHHQQGKIPACRAMQPAWSPHGVLYTQAIAVQLQMRVKMGIEMMWMSNGFMELGSG